MNFDYPAWFQEASKMQNTDLVLKEANKGQSQIIIFQTQKEISKIKSHKHPRNGSLITV